MLAVQAKALNASPSLVAVSNIQSPRNPQPDVSAIYLLAPTLESVDDLVADWARRPQYADAHIFFLSSERLLPAL